MKLFITSENLKIPKVITFKNAINVIISEIIFIKDSFSIIFPLKPFFFE